MLLENISEQKLWQLQAETAKQILELTTQLDNLKWLQKELADEKIRRERNKMKQKPVDETEPGEFYERNRVAVDENTVGWRK